MKNANAKNLVIENLEGTVAEGEEVEIIEPNSTAVRTFFFSYAVSGPPANKTNTKSVAAMLCPTPE